MWLSWSKRCLPALALIAAPWVWPDVFAAAPAAPPAAAPAAGRSNHYVAWRAAAAQALGGHADANSLATAAALSFLGPPHARGEAPRSAAVDLATKASDLDPNDAGIGWLRLQLCAGTQGCDIRDAATTMRWLDADNSAVWMATLAGAQKDRDSEEATRILQEMARGSRFDVYRNHTIVLLFETLRKARDELPKGYVPSDLSRLSEAMAIAGAEVVPQFTPLLAACRDLSASRENCLKLSKLLQRGDAVAAQMAGFTIERRLWPQDSKEARLVAERRRTLEWRVSAASENDTALPWLANALARARAREMHTAAREEDVDIAILRRHNIPLEPPENFR